MTRIEHIEDIYYLIKRCMVLVEELNDEIMEKYHSYPRTLKCILAENSIKAHCFLTEYSMNHS